MEDLPGEFFFIFDFVPEDSLKLRKVCDDWDFVVTKYYDKNYIRNLGIFKKALVIN